MAANFWTSSHCKTLFDEDKIGHVSPADLERRLTVEDVKIIKIQMPIYIRNLAVKARVRQRKSFTEYDPCLVAPTCLYLASKVEENTVQAKHLVNCMKSPRRSCLLETFGDNDLGSGGGQLDVVILSNGPGEVGTWVKPVVCALREHFQGHSDLRISVVLSPCPHASGRELELVRSFKEVDRCQGPENFWQLLLLGRTPEGWDWYKKGACIFLGGDQLYTVMIGRRLGYKTIVYAHENVQWPGLVDVYALSTLELMEGVPKLFQVNCQVVGDLFWDAVALAEHIPSTCSEMEVSASYPQVHGRNMQPVQVVCLLPGSKDVKLAIGVPYMMSVAEHISRRMGNNVQFVLPLAPTVNLESLAHHADALCNPFVARFQWASGKVFTKKSQCIEFGTAPMLSGSQKIPSGYLVTKAGVQIEVYQEFPPYRIFKQCTICLTTVGTNTAELGSLAIPMIVVLPTHAIEAFKGAAGGIVGLLTHAPGWIGDMITRLVNYVVLKTIGFVSWPNRWAGEEIVPELIGPLPPDQVADIAAEYLNSKEKLEAMRKRLFDLRSRKASAYPDRRTIENHSHGAAQAFAILVHQLMNH